MERIKKYAWALCLIVVSCLTFSACEIEVNNEYDEDYHYARQTIVGEWRVQDAFLNRGAFMPYTPGSVMAFSRYGDYSALLYGRAEEERGQWRMDRRSDGLPYMRIEMPLPTGRYALVYANIEQINENYLRLFIDDEDSSYSLILTRRGW